MSSLCSLGPIAINANVASACASVSRYGTLEVSGRYSCLLDRFVRLVWHRLRDEAATELRLSLPQVSENRMNVKVESPGQLLLDLANFGNDWVIIPLQPPQTILQACRSSACQNRSRHKSFEFAFEFASWRCVYSSKSVFSATFHR